jgi:tetratricopeptide (TPR) repeat protein
VIQLTRRSLVATAAGIVGVAAIVTGGWFWYAAEQSRAMVAYAEAMARVRAAQAPQATAQARAAAVRDLEATLARYPSAGAAPQAAYQLAGLRYDAGDYPGARGAYEIVLARGSSGTLRTLAQAALGYTWEAERNYQKAIDAYSTAVANRGPKDFYYESLLIDLARVQELAGRKAEAVATYQRLLKELPQARRAEEIRARLMSLGAS